MSDEQQPGPEETKTTTQPEGTTPSQTPLLAAPVKKRKLSFPALAIIAGVLIIAVAVVASVLNRANEQRRDALQIQSEQLEIVEVTPVGALLPNGDQLKILFNHPVIAHHAQEYIKFVPAVDGTWSQGDSANSIVFNPAQPFYWGTQFKVIVMAGLPSETGKKLIADHSFDFSTRVMGSDIQFTKNGYAYNLSSFSTSSGIDAGLNIGSEVKNPKVKLYSATVNDLLKEYVYDPTFYNLEFKDNTNVSSFKLVQEYNDFGRSSSIQYKGESGVYYAAAFDGDKFVGKSWFTITDLGLLVRQDDQKIYVAGQSIKDNSPLDNVNLSLYSLADGVRVVSRGVLNGISSYPVVFPQKIDFIYAQKDNQIALAPLQHPYAESEKAIFYNRSQRHEVFVNTDRPIYKRGDTVKFRGLVRVDNDGQYLLPKAGTRVKVTSMGIAQTIDVKENGVFEGEVKIPQDVALYNYDGKIYNTYYLDVTTDLGSNFSYSNGSASFDVADYIKPEYGLKVSLDKNETVKGEKIRVNIKGEYFDGRSLANAKINYSLFSVDYYETEKAVYNTSFRLNGWGGMCGGGAGFEYYGEKVDSKEVVLDGSGNAVLEIDTSKLGSKISQQLTVVVESVGKENKVNTVTDATEAIVHGGDFNIFVRANSSGPYSGKEFSVPFTAETMDGAKLNDKDFDYRIYQTKYEYNPEYKRTETTLKTGKVKTNSQGYGVLKEQLNEYQVGAVDIEISGVDGRKNKVVGNTTVYLTAFNDTARAESMLDIVSTKSNLVPGEVASLEINSPAALNVFLTFERGRVYQPQWLALKPGKNTFSFQVPDSYMPTITPTFSYFYNNVYFIEGLSLNVPAMEKLISVEVQADKPEYKPGETAKITITTRDADNNLVSADVGVGVVDKAIYALKKNTAMPLHSSFYYFRPRQTNATSSLNGVWFYDDGGRGGGGGDISAFFKDIDTLYWNPGLKTDQTGRLTIEVPLNSQETIWRILVYASTSDTKVGQIEFDFNVRK